MVWSKKSAGRGEGRGASSHNAADGSKEKMKGRKNRVKFRAFTQSAVVELLLFRVLWDIV